MKFQTKTGALVATQRDGLSRRTVLGAALVWAAGAGWSGGAGAQDYVIRL